MQRIVCFIFIVGGIYLLGFGQLAPPNAVAYQTWMIHSVVEEGNSVIGMNGNYAASPLAKWQNNYEYYPNSILGQMSLLFDINDDGINDVLLGGKNKIYVLDGNNGNLIYSQGLSSDISNSEISFVIGDIEGDGVAEIIALPIGSNVVYVLNKNDGSIQWSFSLEKNGKYASFSGFPGLSDVNHDGYLDILLWNSGYWSPPDPYSIIPGTEFIAISGNTHDILWSWNTLTNEAILIPTVTQKNEGALIYFHIADSIFCLNGDDGSKEWSAWKPDTPNMPHVEKYPVVFDVDGDNNNELFYTCFAGLYCFNAENGALLWLKPFDMSNPGDWDMISIPTIEDINKDGHNNLIYSNTDVIYNIDAESGSVLDSNVFSYRFLAWRIIIANFDQSTLESEILFFYNRPDTNYYHSNNVCLLDYDLNLLWNITLDSLAVNVWSTTVGNIDTDNCLEIIIPYRDYVNYGRNGVLVLDDVFQSSDCGAFSYPVHAGFSYSPASGCDSSCFQFFSQASGPAYQFEWYFPGSFTPFSNEENPRFICYDSSGTYQVIFIAKSGSYTDTLYQWIDIVVSPTPGENLWDTVICSPPPLMLNAGNPGAVYTWNTGETSQQIMAAESDTFTVTVAYNSCVLNDTAYIVFGLPAENWGKDILACSTDSFLLDAGNPAANYYHWNTGDTGRYIWVHQSGVYSVQLETCGQPVSYQAYVTIIDSTQFFTYEMPNVFTPNDDGINDEYWPGLQSESITEMELIIYDRWGLEMFRSGEWNEKWKPSGSVPEGTYFWVMNFTVDCGDQKVYTRKGFLNLFR